MAVYIVSYDISDHNDESSCRAAIKKFDWHEVGESAYLVSTSFTAQEIYDKLKPFVGKGKDDRLYIAEVSTATGHWKGFHTGVSNWLKS